MIRIIILFIALASGGVAAWLASGSPDTPAELETAATEERALQEVLVAASELPRGTVIDEKHMRWQAWEGDVPPVFVSWAARPDAISAFKGFTAHADFVAGEPIRDDKLAERGAGFLSGALPEGKRAIAVRVNAESTAGGFILPNDRVDVIHTVARPGSTGEGGQVTSRTILTNLRVLAIDQVASDNGEGGAVVGKTATLEVEPEQIAVIAAAEASGTVSLALRASMDHDEAPAVVTEKSRTVLVRVFNGEGATLVEVPSSRTNGS